MWEKAASVFKFKLGDLVCHRTDDDYSLAVIERLLIQDEAGVRRSYRCSRMSDGGPMAAVFDECELVEFDSHGYKDKYGGD